MSGIKKLAICIIIIIIISIVVILFVARFLKELSMQIPDTNGINKELCYLSDLDIESCYTDYRAIKRNVYNEHANKSGIQGRYEQFDCEYTRSSFGKLSGIYILNAYLGDGDNVSFTIDSKVKKGNLRIVITDEFNRILYDIPIDETAEVSFKTVKDATYYVKLIGESANISVELWRTEVDSSDTSVSPQ